ncbi:hypothetical protein C7445_102176 [Alicyclobacillus sacchari]|uniref:Uncharacterized protein n=1 Tax=Alicyclobacillus sacchari TaxID=392010 RepID=A0A4R8LV25_9BACL|nr:hypothetical protein [Alicyclobacillus sacchari]TDY50617.1 hypothetical protein C7445_102176 [Alicyclobacillus sacchari]GMA55577.1 hypothetical protein GCM10025858_00800 [Alicyclobacillus sacchari]GMA59183.1 hypothetical protein GCM10025858_36860 [Alicyclobacillus sacchari]
MPTWILIDRIDYHSAQQNAGLFVGITAHGGFDANMKIDRGRASVYGFCNLYPNGYAANLSGWAWMDGAIDDGDVKPTISVHKG